MPREPLTTQIDSEILAGVRTLAEEEGSQIDALVEEALSDLIEKHAPRAQVMSAYLASHEKFAELYKKLAR